MEGGFQPARGFNSGAGALPVGFLARSEKFEELLRRKAGLFQVRHALRRDLHFPQILLTGQLPGDFEVFANGILDVRQSLFFSGALRPAPGQTGARDAVPLFGRHQSNWVPHTSDRSM